MNLPELRRNLSHRLWPIVIAASVFLAACGGGGGGGGSTQTAGIGGTGIVAGKITGFGSIFVNGKEIETDQSQFIVDGDDSASQSDLALGMYVQLRVKTLNGNILEEALDVYYDDEVQGPVVGISGTSSGETQRTFTVFGQNIIIDDTSTIFVGTSFVGLTNNRIVEISGFRTSPNDITATYVEDKGPANPGSEVELRGTISGLAGVAPIQTFQVDGVTINTDISTVLKNGLVLQDTLYVEVEGTYVNATTVAATEIEEEDEDIGDDFDEVSLQGLISNYSGLDDFFIDGQQVDASGASLSPANTAGLLGNGVEVEVEGDIVGNILIADELELRDGESELRTTVRTIDLPGNRFELEYPGNGDSSLGTVWVNVSGQTLFEDESVANLPNFSLDLLMVGNFVRVKGIANLSGINPEVDAETVKRRDPDSTSLEGVVQAKVKPVSITILGITYPVDPAATYEDENGTPMNANDFFDAIVVDTSVVELEDDDPADGDADQVEFDD